MLESNTYRKTEGILYNHFRKKKRISILGCKLLRINNRIVKLKNDIKNCNIELEETLKAIDYSRDRVQGGCVKSNIEVELERASDYLIMDLEYEQRNKRKTESKIRDLNRKIDDIDIILEQLTEDEIELIELKYAEEKTLRQISNILHCGVTTVKRKKDNIIEYIAKELNISGTKSEQNRKNL